MNPTGLIPDLRQFICDFLVPGILFGFLQIKLVGFVPFPSLLLWSPNFNSLDRKTEVRKITRRR